MSFALISATATDHGAGEDTPIVLPLPSGIALGNLLFAMFAHTESEPLVWPGDWNVLHDTHFADISLSCAWKRATGSEDATIEIGVEGSTNFAWICDRIGGTHPTATPVATGTMPAQANTASPNPSNLAPGWTEDTLWYAIGVTDQNSVGITSYPTNYTDNQLLVSGTAIGMARATRNLNAASEDPGVFTFNAINGASAQTAAIRPQLFTRAFGIATG